MAREHLPFTGPFLLTNLLMKKLVESSPSRVITLSSVTHFVVQRFDFDVDYAGDHDLNGYVNYAYSKLANILFSRELGKRLGGKFTLMLTSELDRKKCCV